MARFGPGIPLREAKKLKHPAVYGIMDGNSLELVYVGRTKNLSLRVDHYLRVSQCHNALLQQWLKDNLGDARIVVLLDRNCQHTEAEYINEFKASLFNLTNGHENTWRKHQSYPWMVGTGIRCPSDTMIIALRSRGRRNSPRLDAVKYLRARMSVKERCVYEIEVLRENYASYGRKLEKWLTLATPKLILALESEDASP